MIASEPVRQLGTYPPLAILLDLGGRLLPVILVACAFTFLYKFLTFTRVTLRSAAVGGAVAGLIWLVAGWAFATFVAGTSSYTAIYSAFAALILFLLWLNVNWIILLIGSSIAFYYQHPEYMLLGPGPAILSNRCRERLALAIMQAIGRAQYAGEQPPTVRDLRRRLGVPEEAVQRILTALCEAGLLKTTGDDPPRWVAFRPFDATEMKVLVEAVRRAGEYHGLELTRIAAPPSVDAVGSRIGDAIDQALDGMRLKDLLAEGDSPAGTKRAEPGGRAEVADAAGPSRSGAAALRRQAQRTASAPAMSSPSTLPPPAATAPATAPWWRRRLVVVAAIVAVLVALVVLLLTVAPRYIARYVADRYFTGIEVDVDGVKTIDIDLLMATFSVGPVRFRGGPTSDAGTIGLLGVKLSLSDLFNKQALVRRAVIRGVDIAIKQDADGELFINGIPLRQIPRRTRRRVNRLPPSQRKHRRGAQASTTSRCAMSASPSPTPTAAPPGS